MHLLITIHEYSIAELFYFHPSVFPVLSSVAYRDFNNVEKEEPPAAIIQGTFQRNNLVVTNNNRRSITRYKRCP